MRIDRIVHPFFIRSISNTYCNTIFCKKEKDSPAWTQLKLPGQAPAPRCGHSVTAGGHQVRKEWDCMVLFLSVSVM